MGIRLRYDPFCGGGSIPLEAQRLGLEAHGSDLKTVQKILRGEAVRNDVLQKLADALSQRHCKVNVLDIPQD
jgi:adenine-specific DNA methylase